MKLVINTCYGGFCLSEEGLRAYAARKGLTLYKYGEGWSVRYYTSPEKEKGSYFSSLDIKRDDLDLIEVVEQLGRAANGWAAELKIVEIPEGVDWYIHDYDGKEHVAEVHRSWR